MSNEELKEELKEEDPAKNTDRSLILEVTQVNLHFFNYIHSKVFQYVQFVVFLDIYFFIYLVHFPQTVFLNFVQFLNFHLCFGMTFLDFSIWSGKLKQKFSLRKWFCICSFPMECSKWSSLITGLFQDILQEMVNPNIYILHLNWTIFYQCWLQICNNLNRFSNLGLDTCGLA